MHGISVVIISVYCVCMCKGTYTHNMSSVHMMAYVLCVYGECSSLTYSRNKRIVVLNHLQKRKVVLNRLQKRKVVLNHLQKRIVVLNHLQKRIVVLNHLHKRIVVLNHLQKRIVVLNHLQKRWYLNLLNRALLVEEEIRR